MFISAGLYAGSHFEWLLNYTEATKNGCKWHIVTRCVGLWGGLCSAVDLFLVLMMMMILKVFSKIPGFELVISLWIDKIWKILFTANQHEL